MKEIIQKIEKIDENDLGYIITTNQQIITMTISNYGSCCEAWGFICTEDNIEDYIGAEIINFCLIDEKLFSRPLLLSTLGQSNFSGLFINLETNKGLLQFVIYNIHNGYYGHDVKISSKQLIYNDIL